MVAGKLQIASQPVGGIDQAQFSSKRAQRNVAGSG